eukprot:TRINITY_DN8887_c1_g1_i1.p1 TRINITY_DN8887_c1_g1~~TRINITY_DN8887_c1_g1_i1.p1  ORF type:complete len:565 (-),score=116.06 TRINITY_DN8887_c1_g1_i1:30-1724(-)
MAYFTRSSIIFAAAAAVASAAGLGDGSNFRSSKVRPAGALLDKLEELLGSRHRTSTEARITSLEEALRPIFTALPKNANGAVRPPAVRYALHRLFMQRHAWQFKGLDSRGQRWHSASPSEAFGERMPEDVKTLFESRLQEQGLDLHELAVLAATLENMVHAEADVRLAATFQALGHEEGANLNASDASEALDMYMASFVLGTDISQLDTTILLRQQRDVRDQYPSWPETQSFVRQVQEGVLPNATDFTFAGLSDVVAEVGERYGKWQSSECTDLKHTLLESEEYPNTGRIRLKDFYSLALHGGKWQFSESVSFLRQLGALDESDPSTLRVILPNYLLGPSNCIASSGYYAACCLDECEGFLGQLEQKIGSHEAEPEEILKVIASTASPGTFRNQSLAPALQKRLAEIASHHRGKVPLHGRLFAQWLHHVYPRECPYPHMSGTTSPLTAEEFTESGQVVSASEDEMLQIMESTPRKGPPTHEEGMCSNMWTMEEELVDEASHGAAPHATSTQTTRGNGFILAGATAALSLVLVMARTVKQLFTGESDYAKAPARATVEIGKIYAV